MTNLGLFFQRNSVNKADVYYKTGIDESRLSLLSNDSNTLLYADEFYLIVKAIRMDIGIVSGEVFGSYKLNFRFNKGTNGLSDFGKYITQFLNSKKDLAESTGILQSRFSKLINDPDKRPYASEIYLVALSTQKEPKDLFELLYGHLKINSIEEQATLRKMKSKR